MNARTDQLNAAAKEAEAKAEAARLDAEAKAQEIERLGKLKEAREAELEEKRRELENILQNEGGKDGMIETVRESLKNKEEELTRARLQLRGEGRRPHCQGPADRHTSRRPATDWSGRVSSSKRRRISSAPRAKRSPSCRRPRTNWSRCGSSSKKRILRALPRGRRCYSPFRVLWHCEQQRPIAGWWFCAKLRRLWSMRRPPGRSLSSVSVAHRNPYHRQ